MRQSEVARTALSFLVLLLVVGAYTVVKSVRDAVFLSQFAVTELSLMSVGLALLSGGMVAVYLRATAGLPRGRLVVLTYGAIALTLFLLALGVREPGPPRWLPWLLYLWSSVFGLFIVMQFWLLASHVFDVREAKRAFGPVAIGAVVGGLIGGVTSRALAASAGASGLLVIAALALLSAAAAARALGRSARAEPQPVARPSEAGERRARTLLHQPPYVRLLAAGLILATAVGTLLDWQLKAVAKQAFGGDTEALAGFFGAVYAYVSAGSLLLQLLFTSRLLRRYGVGAARALLPLTALAAFVALLSSAALPFSLLALLTAARLAEGSVRFAFQQPATELSWLPLPTHQREVGKSLVDVVGDRMGTGLAGLSWVAVALLAHDETEALHALALIGAALVVLWLLFLRRTQRAYVAAMRSALAGRAVDLESLWRSLGQEQTRRTIVDALESGDPSQVSLSLYLLEGWDADLPDLRSALGHERSDIRLQALRLLSDKAGAAQREAAWPCAQDPEPEVREAAIIYLRRTAPAGPDPLLSALPGQDPDARLTRWLIAPSADGQVGPERGSVMETIATAEAEARTGLIRMLGAAAPEAAAPLLAALLDDPDERAAAAAIRAAGRARIVELVPALAAKLAQRPWRPHVFRALADIGRPALAQLLPVLSDASTPPAVRRAIIRLTGASRDPAAAAALLPLLDGDSLEVAREALRALVRLRTHAEFAVDRDLINAKVSAEASELGRELLVLGAGAWPQAREADVDGDFLTRTIRDSANARVERLFRLLGLIHAPGDVQSAYRGLRSARKATRSRSVDFLDNLLEPEQRPTLLPLFEDADPAHFAAAMKRAFGIAAVARSSFVERLRRSGDPWLQRVAEWSASSQEDKTMRLSVVEKALKLSSVDVLARVSSEQLAYIANIAEEIELPADAQIYGHGDAPDALYVILAGAVRLHQEGEDIGVLGTGEAFGSWALIDDAPRVASAVADGPVTLLKVEREEFLELLGDRVDIVQAIFKAMVERIRSLVELAQQR